MKPRRPRASTTGALATVLTLVLAACTGTGSTGESETSGGEIPGTDALRVVATTTVLADLVQQVGGERVNVHSLVPRGGEVHTFDPSPSDASKVADAQLLVINGLGLDDWLGDMAADAGADNVPMVRLAEGLQGVAYLEGDDHDGEPFNPHLWLNVEYGVLYVERLADALAEVDPEEADAYRANADDYIAELQELDGWAREQMAGIPDTNRKVISFHEAFPYFAEAYDLEIIGTVVDAPGQDPSAGEVTALIDTIRDEEAAAIFTEAQFPTTAAERISEETGLKIVGTLYNDSVGEAPADSYIGMMRWNVEQVVEALQ
jgi:zinc/manganese transport system substrate-binding protein/manganese/iron transport system substrate-binding protein